MGTDNAEPERSPADINAGALGSAGGSGGTGGAPSVDTAEARPGGAAQRTLRTNQLLRQLPDATLDQLETQCRWLHLDTNDVVFDQDDPSRDVFFIVEGRLRIVVFRESRDQREDFPVNAPQADDEGPSDTEAEQASIKAGLVAFEALVDEGAPMTLTEMVAGDTFGELSAIDGRMRSARAVALEPSLVAVLDGDSFVSLVQTHGTLAITLLQHMAGYLRVSNRRMYNLSTLTAKQRIYVQLARLAEVNPNRPTEWIVDPLPPHTDIAFWAGTKRETVASAIGWLAREGIVSRQHRALLIRQPARLKALAHV